MLFIICSMKISRKPAQRKNNKHNEYISIHRTDWTDCILSVFFVCLFVWFLFDYLFDYTYFIFFFSVNLLYFRDVNRFSFLGESDAIEVIEFSRWIFFLNQMMTRWRDLIDILVIIANRITNQTRIRFPRVGSRPLLFFLFLFWRVDILNGFNKERKWDQSFCCCCCAASFVHQITKTRYELVTGILLSIVTKWIAIEADWS